MEQRRAQKIRTRSKGQLRNLTESSPNQADSDTIAFIECSCLHCCARVIQGRNKSGVETEVQRGDVTCLRPHSL